MTNAADPRTVEHAVSFRAWVQATVNGWIAGLFAVIALAFVWDAIGWHSTQVFVGIGMGGPIGMFQGRMLAPRLGSLARWALPLIVGLSVPLLAVDALRTAGWTSVYVLPLAIAVAGLICGVWQARVLQIVGARAVVWVGASLVGWSAAALMVATADALRIASRLPTGLPGALSYLTVIVAGGALLGVATGASLRVLPLAPVSPGNI